MRVKFKVALPEEFSMTKLTIFYKNCAAATAVYSYSARGEIPSTRQRFQCGDTRFVYEEPSSRPSSK